jgi:hypothetical protein
MTARSQQLAVAVAFAQTFIDCVDRENHGSGRLHTNHAVAQLAAALDQIESTHGLGIFPTKETKHESL